MRDQRIVFDWLDLADPATEREGVEIPDGSVRLTEPVGRRDDTDPFGDGSSRTYDYATWTSPPRRIPFPATSVVTSWAATTPDRSWIEIAVRGRTDPDTDWTPWLVVACWAATDDEIHPTTVPDQSAGGATGETDEIRIDADRAWTAVQLQVTLLRRAGSADRPELARLGVMASAVPRGDGASLPPTSRPTLTEPIELDVPAYSQQLHRDRYPEYNGGGQTWCSPTATSMVLAYFDALPAPDAYEWVDPTTPDRFVVHAARRCFDHAYDGAGNWAFNTAYAATRGLEAFVTRLRSLAEAEAFIAAGIPLVMSLAFTEDELDGAGYETTGHLITLAGFTASGDPVVNDPASHRIRSNDAVRTTYRRDQLETLWLRTSGGAVYVMRPAHLPLPPPPAEPNW